MKKSENKQRNKKKNSKKDNNRKHKEESKKKNHRQKFVLYIQRKKLIFYWETKKNISLRIHLRFTLKGKCKRDFLIVIKQKCVFAAIILHYIPLEVISRKKLRNQYFFAIGIHHTQMNNGFYFFKFTF